MNSSASLSVFLAAVAFAFAGGAAFAAGVFAAAGFFFPPLAASASFHASAACAQSGRGEQMAETQCKGSDREKTYLVQRKRPAVSWRSLMVAAPLTLQHITICELAKPSKNVHLQVGVFTAPFALQCSQFLRA